MQYTFTSYEVRWPERGSTWTGYRTRAEADRTAGTEGVVHARTWTAEVPEWRIASLEAEIAAGTNEAVPA